MTGLIYVCFTFTYIFIYLFVCSQVKIHITSQFQLRYGSMIVNGELEEMWEVAYIILFRMLSQHFLVVTYK